MVSDKFRHGNPSDASLEDAAQHILDTQKAQWPPESIWRTGGAVAMAMSGLTSLARIAAVLERMEDKP